MNKFNNVQYIDGPVTEAMNLEIESTAKYREGIAALHKLPPPPIFEFHLFRIPSEKPGEQPPWEVNFVIMGRKNMNEKNAPIYKQNMNCELEDLEKTCKFLHMEYQMEKNAGFTGMLLNLSVQNSKNAQA